MSFNAFNFRTANKKTAPQGRFFYLHEIRLSLRFLKGDALAQRRIELLEFNLALGGLSVLTSPDNVVGLRGFEPKQAVL